MTNQREKKHQTKRGKIQVKKNHGPRHHDRQITKINKKSEKASQHALASGDVRGNEMGEEKVNKDHVKRKRRKEKQLLVCYQE